MGVLGQRVSETGHASYPCECHVVSSLIGAFLTGVLCGWWILGRNHSGWACIFLALGSPITDGNLCRVLGWACPWKTGYPVHLHHVGSLPAYMTGIAAHQLHWRVTPIIMLLAERHVMEGAHVLGAPTSHWAPLPVPKSTQASLPHTIKATGKAATCFNTKPKSQVSTSHGSMLVIPNATLSSRACLSLSFLHKLDCSNSFPELISVKLRLYKKVILRSADMWQTGRKREL